MERSFNPRVYLEFHKLIRLERLSTENNPDGFFGHLDHGAERQHLIPVIVNKIENLMRNVALDVLLCFEYYTTEKEKCHLEFRRSI